MRCFGPVVIFAGLLSACLCADTFIFVNFYQDDKCTVPRGIFAGNATVPHGDQYLFDFSTIPIYINCPTADSADQINATVYYVSGDAFYQNITLGACVPGPIFNSIHPYYEAVCADSTFPPNVQTSVYAKLTYKDESTCTTGSGWGRADAYVNDTCYYDGEQFYYSYGCADGQVLETAQCLWSNCTECATSSTYPIASCTGGPGGIITFSAAECWAAPIPPASAPVGAPVDAPIDSPAAAPVESQITAPISAPASASTLAQSFILIASAIVCVIVVL